MLSEGGEGLICRSYRRVNLAVREQAVVMVLKKNSEVVGGRGRVEG